MEDQATTIELKLTYNKNGSMPRNFFVHLYHVPVDASVRVINDGQEMRVRRSGDYADSRFWVAQDKTVRIVISQGDTVIASDSYLIHDDTFFTHVDFGKAIKLIQFVYMG